MSFDSINYSPSATDVGAPSPTAAGRLVGFLSSCASIGAVCESSRWLARRMAQAASGTESPIVELGAGYGSVTGLLPEAAVSLERDAKRFHYLKAAFPDRTILNSCAIEFLDDLKRPTVVVSSIPSVNNPEFGALRASVGRAVKTGRLVKLITYTYFPINPFAGVFPKCEMVGCEVLNLPPAILWRYSC